jgi:hypothetical protein
MADREVAAFAWVCTEAVHGAAAAVPAVRDLALRRRRSKIPWMYRVYHAARQAAARPDSRAPRDADAVAERGSFDVY